LWTVGFYTPEGKWVAESDHSNAEEAAKRVHYLNGGNEQQAFAALQKYPCAMCGYESDMKHYYEWRGMCYQCYAGETEFKA
jgi:hypothetical protein